MIKSVFYWSVIAVSFAFIGYTLYINSLDACEMPHEYAIGRFDEKFGISREDFLKSVSSAESVWEKSIGRDVFGYDPDASFKINLIYDDRQIATVQKQKTESGFSQAEELLKSLDAEFNTLKLEYEKDLAYQKSAASSFESRQAEYEKQVDFWNSRGGAPKEKFAELEKERQYLNSEAQRLNQEAESLKDRSEELNRLLDRRNDAAEGYNRAAEDYNKRYGGGLEFDQAEYTGDAINVYQFGDGQDLTLALTHELGHWLGMDHVENGNSIMYYLTSDSSHDIIPSAQDLEELNRVCKK